MRWIRLLGWLGLCFLVAGVSGTWTASEIPGWYRTLAKPAISPPDWLFGPVWTLLYTLMAVAVWLIWQSPASRWRKAGVVLFLVQLTLNLAWPWLFFHQHTMGIALMEIIVLWATIGVTTLFFGRVRTLAAWLMTPYWLWVTFAAVLNEEFWRLN